MGVSDIYTRRTSTLGRAHSANLAYYPLLTPLLYLLWGGRVGDRNQDILGLFIKDHSFLRRLSLKTVQPVKEIYQRFQSLLLAGLDHFTHFRPLTRRFYVILELEVLPLERDGVVQEELRNVLENIWYSIP